MGSKKRVPPEHVQSDTATTTPRSWWLPQCKTLKIPVPFKIPPLQE